MAKGKRNGWMVDVESFDPCPSSNENIFLCCVCVCISVCIWRTTIFINVKFLIDFFWFEDNGTKYDLIEIKSSFKCNHDFPLSIWFQFHFHFRFSFVFTFLFSILFIYYLCSLFLFIRFLLYTFLRVCVYVFSFPFNVFFFFI